MTLFNSYDNPDAVLIELLKYLNKPVPPQKVVEELDIHPDYPSLLALNDVLNNFGVPASAYRITTAEVTDVPCPFIAHTRKSGAEFMLVKKLDKQKVVVSDQLNSSRTLSMEKFSEIFDGILLVPDEETANTEIKTPAYELSVEEMRYPLALGLLGMVFLIAMVYYSSLAYTGGWILPLAALFKTAGLVTAVLLLIQSIDKNNPLVQTLCGGSEKANCNAILTSKAAKVFNWLSWSEVGFFYFAGTWLALVFAGSNTAMLQTLAILNILSLPYTVYSIYYQARIAKQWCVFCCAIQALLWLEFIPLVSSLKQPFNYLSMEGWASLLICLSLPVAVWLLLKPVLLKAQQVKQLKNQLRRFKYNTELFNTSLKEQPKYANPDIDWSIVLGNVEAGNIITMVSNPYCPPCAKAHNVLDEWLSHNPDMQLRIVFTANNNDDDIKTTVSRHLMALNELPDKSKVKQALHDWYEQKQKNYEAWAKVHPVNLDETKYDKLERQKEWCTMAEVKATPTLLVNGYRLPEAYQIKDIKYMLE
ncbi:cysteine peptidase family C39 domain-containing protein [Mucilaginibacter segetis]|uniref:Thioredoxin domain-containing protein n=1 Tax=Mucilaginibacter segetis TaxID=2793071 RepID=A0A934ULS3_9SPHI|nr:cysteine peptidase family C39 domain-containing protein [Mucilaginibacter segetis]MBK0378893.1 thioredoxin domain-containing protein [Mucilaginibacter segetis]